MINKQEILDLLLQKDNFIQAIFVEKKSKDLDALLKTKISFVLKRDRVNYKVEEFYKKNSTVKILKFSKIEKFLDTLLDGDFLSNIEVFTSQKDLKIRVTKKGKVLKKYFKPQLTDTKIKSHNREKKYLINPNNSTALLNTLGITDVNNNIKGTKQKKYRQINNFLKIFTETVAEDFYQKDIINIVDFGCGNAYLTLSLYHYLNNILNVKLNMYGVDYDESAINRNIGKASNLNYDNLKFIHSKIADFDLLKSCDVVISLHACDTATDDVLYLANKMQSSYILSSPCCHHNIQAQLDLTTDNLFSYKILKERFGDVLTDSLRGLWLNTQGYKTNIIQFIQQKETAKNLLIIAKKESRGFNNKEFEELQKKYNVQYYLTKVRDS